MAKNMGILVYFLLQSPFLFHAKHWNWFWHHSARKGREQMPQRRDGSGEEKKIPVGIKGNTLILFILCEFPHQTLPEGYLISNDRRFPRNVPKKMKNEKKETRKRWTQPQKITVLCLISFIFSLTRLYPITWIIMQIILSSQLQKARGQGDMWADQMGNPVLRRNRNHATRGTYILPEVSVRRCLNSQGVWCPRKYLGSKTDSPLCCFSMGHLPPRPTKTSSNEKVHVLLAQQLQSHADVDFLCKFLPLECFLFFSMSYLFGSFAEGLALSFLP